MKKYLPLLILALIALSGCNREVSSPRIRMFPDYTDIAIPYNMAPLNFNVTCADRIELRASNSSGQWRFNGRKGRMRFNQKKWKEMMLSSLGDTLTLSLTAICEGHAVELEQFWWAVMPQPIDKYLSYRLIEPCYEVWNKLSIEERDLESFKTRRIADNSITGSSCMNCHISNRALEQTTFLHARGKDGGTIYRRGDVIRKIDTSTDSTDGPAVYGEISADGRFGIFTTARIRPILNSSALGRLEVYDNSSDLILTDFEKNTISDSPLVKGSAFQETFPCWSAAGDRIYFCRAESLPQPDSTFQMRYNLYSIDFDSEQGWLGQDLRLELDACSMGKSISFPKCSPDGTHLLMSVSDYGTFPIWHLETDLWMLDLQTGDIDRMEMTNGDYSDSYHCFSSSGRWVCWASKRDDRVYGRPYFAYVNEDGSCTKAFVLPQKDPESYNSTLKSYNIPELYQNKESYGPWDVREAYRKTECEKMQYVSVQQEPVLK
ncbi:MAG: hypothetical protein KBT00_05665 [Bacteroidales bacterium]|nr:hypothetical protein [Candidatus Cacconaster merdequi]